MSIFRKTIKTASIGFQTSLIYKYSFLLQCISSIFSLFIQLIFWPAFYNASTEYSYATIENTAIAGYYLSEMITYSILVYFIQRGTSMMNIGGGIKSDIMSGGLNIHLIRPIQYLWNKWVSSISSQIISFVLSIVVFMILLLFFKVVFVLPDNISQVVFLILFIFFAYVLAFLISCIIGMLSFWVLETKSFNVLLNAGISILSGSIFPINLINNNLGIILKYLPFSYLAFFPTQIYLNKVDTTQIIHNIVICVTWIFLLILIVNRLWKNGIRRYSAFGG